MNFNRAELMAIVFSRALRDGDVVVTGTNARIPTAAYRTAQLCGKPRIVAMIGASGTIDPHVEEVPASGGDQAFVPGRLTLGLATGVSDQVRGLADVIFLGGLQLDRRGRCNLAVVGDYHRPQLRGPGSIGLSMVARIKRTFMFFETHDPRVFVESVDFISGETVRAGEDRELLVVTPLGVLGSTPGSATVALKSVHRGVSFDEIQKCTGFALNGAGFIETPEPTPHELAALRSFPAGRRLQEIEIA